MLFWSLKTATPFLLVLALMFLPLIFKVNFLDLRYLFLIVINLTLILTFLEDFLIFLVLTTMIFEIFIFLDMETSLYFAVIVYVFGFMEGILKSTSPLLFVSCLYVFPLKLIVTYWPETALPSTATCILYGPLSEYLITTSLAVTLGSGTLIVMFLITELYLPSPG